MSSLKKGLRKMGESVFDTQNYLNHNKYIQTGRHRGLTPWEESPYRLISWWGMNEFTLEAFYEIGRILEKSKQAYLLSEQEKIQEGTSGKISLSEPEIVILKKSLEFVEYHCNSIALRHSAGTIKLFRTYLEERSDPVTTSQVSARFEEINRSIELEMKLHLFMYIPVGRAEYWQSCGESKRAERGEEIPLFGNIVKEKFQSLDYDVNEAGNCFATGRYTACVFHLMRVLETGLAVLAKKFNVSSDRTNWHNIIEQIESKIRDMGKEHNKSSDRKAEHEFYSEIASHFMFLKEPRNSVAHGRGKYTEEEAERIMGNVKDIIQKLATKLSEQKNEEML